MANDIGLYLEEIFCQLSIEVKEAVARLIIEYVDQNWSKLDQTTFISSCKKLIENLDGFENNDEKQIQRLLMVLCSKVAKLYWLKDESIIEVS
jgi:hypothetical protein